MYICMLLYKLSVLSKLSGWTVASEREVAKASYNFCIWSTRALICVANLSFPWLQVNNYDELHGCFPETFVPEQC